MYMYVYVYQNLWQLNTTKLLVQKLPTLGSSTLNNTEPEYKLVHHKSHSWISLLLQIYVKHGHLWHHLLGSYTVFTVVFFFTFNGQYFTGQRKFGLVGAQKTWTDIEPNITYWILNFLNQDWEEFNKIRFFILIDFLYKIMCIHVYTKVHYWQTNKKNPSLLHKSRKMAQLDFSLVGLNLTLCTLDKNNSHICHAVSLALYQTTQF